jgi:sodium transport system ATP-binding protein
MTEILIVNNLMKSFKLTRKQRRINKTKNKKKIAVNDLSFKDYKGEIFGLLGPNGAGKTTSLRMISTLINPDKGEIIIDGVKIKDDKEKARSKIGFLTSELKLEDFFTPNYLYDYFSKLHNVDSEISKSRKEYLFNKFQIDSYKEVKIADLSSGMKQKISLIISVVHNPNIIIFDEPTNGLDIITAKIVTDFLIDLKNEGKTIILSTHIFSLAEKLCDRVGIIIDGKMVKNDTIENLTQNCSLEDLFFDLFEGGSL